MFAFYSFFPFGRQSVAFSIIWDCLTDSRMNFILFISCIYPVLYRVSYPWWFLTLCIVYQVGSRIPQICTYLFTCSLLDFFVLIFSFPSTNYKWILLLDLVSGIIRLGSPHDQSDPILILIHSNCYLFGDLYALSLGPWFTRGCWKTCTFDTHDVSGIWKLFIYKSIYKPCPIHQKPKT